MNNIIIDTGFWFALFDKTDQHHQQAIEIVDYLELGNILIPFPTLYETINSRFSERKDWFSEFEKILNKDNVKLIYDEDYKNDALDLSFESSLRKNRPLSLVDNIIRLMLNDDHIKIDYLISFNIKDFADVCRNNQIEFLNN